jgi:hypothetical protein
MEKESVPLNKKNYITIGALIVFLIIGAIGKVFNQEWAENIYTFWSCFTMVVFICFAISKTLLKPIKPFVVMYTLNLFMCVAFGWWWLVMGWVITHLCCFYGMYQWDLKHNPQPEKDKESPK